MPRLGRSPGELVGPGAAAAGDMGVGEMQGGRIPRRRATATIRPARHSTNETEPVLDQIVGVAVGIDLGHGASIANCSPVMLLWFRRRFELCVDAGPDGATAWVTTTAGREAVTADGTKIAPPWAQ